MELSHGVVSAALLWKPSLPSIATGLTYHLVVCVIQLPSSSEPYPTRSEQLLKYQLGVWGAPREFANFTPRVTIHYSTNYFSEDI